MLTIPANNMMSKLCFNLQPRLIYFPWLRVTVRCFSHNPVRYIPKKLRECSSSVDNAPKHGSTSISSNKNLDRIIKHSRGTTVHHLCSIDDDAHGFNEDTKHETKTFQEGVEHMNVPVQELQAFKRDGHDQFRGQGSKLSQEDYFYDGAMDTNCLEELADVEEMQDFDSIAQRKQESSKTCRSRTMQDVEKSAIELLAKRAFTRVELRKKLIAKHFPINIVEAVVDDLQKRWVSSSILLCLYHFPINIVEAVVDDLQKRGLINDSLYAEMFSHSRWKSSTWGPRRIKQALVNKGVSEGDVQKAVKSVFEDDEDCDLRSSTKLSSSSLQQLYVQSFKQWQRSQNVPHETRKARIIRWLQYRGFDWAVVSIILKKLESEFPP